MSMKKQTASYIVTGVAVALIGIGVASAAWSEPSFPPVSVNSAPPVNSGRVHQIKSQGLGVNTFFVAGNAQFDQAVFAGGIIRGGSPTTNPMTPSVITFGDATNVTSIEANDEIRVQDTITATPLGSTTIQQLCADAQGYIVPCQ